ncbi:hypothetical protein ACHAP5_005372 [Fusarium lateritium]
MPGTQMVWPADPFSRACPPDFSLSSNCLLNDIRTLGLNIYHHRVPNTPLQKIGAPLKLAAHRHIGLEDPAERMDDCPPLTYWWPQYQPHIASLTGWDRNVGPVFSAVAGVVPPDGSGTKTPVVSSASTPGIFSNGSATKTGCVSNNSTSGILPDESCAEDDLRQELESLMNPPTLAKGLSEELRLEAEAWNTAIERLAAVKGKTIRSDASSPESPKLSDSPTAKRRKFSQPAQNSLQRSAIYGDELSLIPEEEKIACLNEINALPVRASGWYKVQGLLQFEYATKSSAADVLQTFWVDTFSSLSRNQENNSSLEDRFLSILRATGILDDGLVANLNIDNDWKAAIKVQVSRRLSKNIVDSMETCAMLLKHAEDNAVVKDIVVEQLRVLAIKKLLLPGPTIYNPVQ